MVLVLRPFGSSLGPNGRGVSLPATACREWQRRGYADSCAAKILDDLRAAGVTGPACPVPELRQAGRLPPWLGDADLHRSHRSALVRKDPDFYRPRLGDVPPDLPYVWPGRPSG